MKLIDLDAKQGYLLDGKYKVRAGSDYLPVSKQIKKLLMIIAVMARGKTMKKLEIEMPDNIDCMIIAYLETVSVGNINVGQMCVGRQNLNAGKIVIDTTVSTLKQEWRKFDEQETEEKESEAPDDADHRGDLR